MELITTERPTSWTERLERMEIGSAMLVDISAINSVRAAKNRVLKISEKRYTTKKILVSEPKKTEALEIKRVK